MTNLEALKDDKDLRTIFIFALRYSLPRHTYAFYIVSAYILQEIDSFQDWEIKGMIEDCGLFYPDADCMGDICDQPLVDSFRDRLTDELVMRKIRRGEKWNAD